MHQASLRRRPVLASTRTAPDGAREWTMNDEPIRLRFWGTDRTIDLPNPIAGAEWVIGASSTNWLPLQDPTHFVSRRHAQLVHHEGRWRIEDLGSKNGTWEDGARRDIIALTPGVEIGIGIYRLIAESPRTIELRALLARMIGYSPSRFGTIDRALRSLREASMLRTPLLLTGEGDLIAIARRLHRAVVGTSMPFVVADPRRREHAKRHRGPVKYSSGVEALEAAAGGMLCVWEKRPPGDFSEVLTRLVDPDCRVRLLICARTTQSLGMAEIRIPSLSTREIELDRVIKEYASDAIDLLRAHPSSFTVDDHRWLVARQPRSLSEIERSTLRLVAIRECGGVSKGALRLGMNPSAMSRWRSRRPRRG